MNFVPRRKPQRFSWGFSCEDCLGLVGFDLSLMTIQDWARVNYSLAPQDMIDFKEHVLLTWGNVCQFDTAHQRVSEQNEVENDD